MPGRLWLNPQLSDEVKIYLLGHFDQMVMLHFLSVQMIWPPSQSRSGPYHPPNFQFLNEGDLDISFPISSQLRICGKNKGSRICGASSRGSSRCAQTTTVTWDKIKKSPPFPSGFTIQESADPQPAYEWRPLCWWSAGVAMGTQCTPGQ